MRLLYRSISRVAHVQLAIFALCACATPACGQANPDSVHLRERCRFAAQIVATGHPAPHEEWAVAFVRNCGAQGASALASGFAKLRTEQDTAAIQPFVRTAVNWRDGAVGDAAQSIAGDKRATEAARAYAFYVLLRYRGRDLGTDYARLTGVGATEICTLGVMDHPPTREGAPLSAGFQDATLALADRVAADPAEPAAVRSAARCVQDAFRRSRAVGR